MNHSIRKNFGYNVILTMSTYIFGLIVFPYVSRVLGVDMIGRVNFADQIVGYLRMLAAMGVGTVGVREIAACGNDREKRSQVFSDILSFILLLTVASLVILVVLTFTVPKMTAIKNLLLIGSFYLFFSSMMIEWFYQGIEDFKFVALRSIAVKIVYVLSIFIFVKSPDDYLVYYILITGTTVANSLINFGFSRKYVDFSLRRSKPGRFAKSILALGVYMVMLSFFSTFNVVYLGMVKGEHEVGVYTTATKIYSLILGILTAYTSVMMPRMSALLSEHRDEEFKTQVSQSFSLVFSVAIPLIIGGVVMAPEIVSILAGNEYSEAVPVMMTIMPLVLCIGMAQVWVIQILLPMKKDNVVLWSAVISAAVGIVLNVALVRKYSYIGSAMAMVGAEVTNDVITMIYALRKKLFKFPLRMCMKYLVYSIPYIVVCLCCSYWLKNDFISLGTAIALCLGWFIYVINKQATGRNEAI